MEDIRAPDKPLDLLIRAVYWVGFRAELAVNFFLRPRACGAYVAVWLDGRLLLIRNSYKDVYTMPAGKIEPGELAIEAARRELREEVGIETPTDALQPSFETLNLSECKRDLVRVFDLRLQHLPHICLDGREVVWAGFRDPQSALQLPLHPAVAAYVRAHGASAATARDA
ncbi:MAG: NUDIX hydrolase [Thiohalocapsa sp.]|nr:NUDIX hydrolase [Thiohalocapsa sp.]MCF7991585.1 NUDIX hydrolase [Thiohalocapsa sp.]